MYRESQHICVLYILQVYMKIVSRKIGRLVSGQVKPYPYTLTLKGSPKYIILVDLLKRIIIFFNNEKYLIVSQLF